jgi:peptidoglycan hydrolase-like amidase
MPPIQATSLLNFALLFLWLISISPAYCLESDLLVSLFAAHQPCKKIYVKGHFTLRQSLNNSEQNGLFAIRESPSGALIFTPLNGSHSSSVSLNTNRVALDTHGSTISVGVSENQLRSYRGSLIVTADGGKLMCMNRVKRDDYMISVLGSETTTAFPLEALKAQSVLIQTSMLSYHRGDQLNDSTEKQAYLGADYEREPCKSAYLATRGHTLKIDFTL